MKHWTGHVRLTNDNKCIYSVLGELIALRDERLPTGHPLPNFVYIKILAGVYLVHSILWDGRTCVLVRGELFCPSEE